MAERAASGLRVPGDIAIRPARRADFTEILRLNAEWVRFTSDLDPAGLERLHAQSAHHRVVVSGTRIAGFLIALREGVDYASPNYRWFDSRGGRFLYVDRVIVERVDQGRGIATLLYDDLLAFARKTEVGRIVCELDAEPPNEASRLFHDRHGFVEVGTQWVAGGTKRVSLRELDVR